MTLVVRLLIVAVFGGFGLVMIYVGVTQFFRQRRLLAGARRIEVEILEARVQSSTSADTDPRPLRSTSTTTHAPVVRFCYFVDGVAYESDLLYPTIIVRTYASHGAAAEQLAAFPVGARVAAYVDPASPDKAFLIAESSAAPVVFIAVGLLLPPLAWLAGLLV